jgi:YD repeat-containing protein
VDYPAGTDLHFEYDALQRRTKMVDAIGTTTYTYTLGSGMSLIAEDGPWASDTLTVTNRLGRRLGLHLQQPSGPTWSQIHTYKTIRSHAHKVTRTSPGGGRPRCLWTPVRLLPSSTPGPQPFADG